MIIAFGLLGLSIALAFLSGVQLGRGLAYRDVQRRLKDNNWE